MKIKAIYDELLSVITKAGITVRKEHLFKSRGGYCMLNENKLIILNKLLPIEAHASILARCISDLDLADDTFLAPAIRQYIDVEAANRTASLPIEFIIENNDNIKS